MKRVAVMLLQRNLPSASDALIDALKVKNEDLCDFYVIESGSDADKLSKHCSFWANWDEATSLGLHYCRGMNFGLSELHATGKRYDYYFMLMGDTKFDDGCDVSKLVALMDEYGRIGILSPWSHQWKGMIAKSRLTLHYLVPHVAWMFRDEFLSLVIDGSDPKYMHYFYDGDNMRGYDADTELGLKAYQNDYCLAVTDEVMFREDHDLMASNADIIKTEKQALHRKLMYEEGLAWLKKKYGFKSKNEMRTAVFEELKRFVDRHPNMANKKDIKR